MLFAKAVVYFLESEMSRIAEITGFYRLVSLFLGSRVIEALLRNHPDVVGVDVVRASDLERMGYGR